MVKSHDARLDLNDGTLGGIWILFFFLETPKSSGTIGALSLLCFPALLEMKFLVCQNGTIAQTKIVR